MVNITRTVRMEIPLSEIVSRFKIKGSVIKFAVPSRMKRTEPDKDHINRVFPPLVIIYVPALRQEPEAEKEATELNVEYNQNGELVKK